VSSGKNKIYEIADNEAEYKRYRRLLSSESFGVEDLNETLLEKGAKALSKEKEVYVIEDESEIRKESSQKMEGLMGVRDLKGRGIINGYRTENTIAVKEKEIILLSTKVFSANEKDFLSETQIRLESIKQVSKALKSKNNNLKIIQVKDRGYDDQKIFQAIIQEGDFFIIRASHLKRIVEQKGVQKKISEVTYEGNFCKKFEKLKIKNKIYQNVKTEVRYAEIILNGDVLHLVKIELKDRKNQSVFDSSMILITNLSIATDEESFAVYRGYLKRWKIEGVFQFIKETLGWEKFQIRDLKGIKKIVALTYLVAAYFYELGEGLIKQEYIEFLSRIGKGKGKITRKALIQGLQSLINSIKILNLIKVNYSKKKASELLKKFGFDKESEEILRCVQF